MKSLLQQLVLMAAMVGLVSPAMAHALWIQTAAQGTQEQAHSVQIFYGEFATGEIDSVAKWYSDVPDFQLWLHAPSGEKTALETTPGATSFQSTFTPTESGTYTLSIAHPAKDLAGEYRYQFISVAYVQVGPSADPAVIPQVPLFLQHQPQELEAGSQVEVSVMADGKPLGQAAVLLMSQEGWSKTFQADAQGKVTLPLPWKGTYVLEVSRTQPASGQSEGRSYSQEWQGSTTSLTVN